MVLVLQAYFVYIYITIINLFPTLDRNGHGAQPKLGTFTQQILSLFHIWIVSFVIFQAE